MSDETSRVSYMNFRNLSQDTVTIVLPNTHSQALEPTQTTGGLSMSGDYYIRKAGTTAGIVNYYKFNLNKKGGATLEPLEDVPDGAEFQAFFRLN